MKKLLEFLVLKITGIDDFLVEEEEEEGFVNLALKVPAGSAGLIIGKEGKTIKRIRNILRVKAALLKKGVNVSVEEK